MPLLTLTVLTACTVEADPPPPSAPSLSPSPPVALPVTGQAARTAIIVTGELLSSDPGQGAGVFVVYQGDGSWRVSTTCDTAVTGLSCTYAYTLRGVAGRLLEPVLDATDGSMQLVRYPEGYDVGHVTTTGTEGLSVVVDPPGASLEIAVWLDGDPDARLIYWVSPAGVEHGASTNPIILRPSAP